MSPKLSSSTSAMAVRWEAFKASQRRIQARSSCLIQGLRVGWQLLEKLWVLQANKLYKLQALDLASLSTRRRKSGSWHLLPVRYPKDAFVLQRFRTHDHCAGL